MLLEDRHRLRNSLVRLGDEVLPLIHAAEVFVPPPAEAGRAQALGSSLLRRNHVPLEIGGVALRKADSHLEIHPQFRGAPPQLVKVGCIKRIESGLNASGAERRAVLQKIIGRPRVGTG